MFHIVIFLHIGLKQQYFVSSLQMFCQNCGADISNSGAKFCRSCDTELNSITKSNTSTGGQSTKEFILSYTQTPKEKYQLASMN